jgi:hypothetical protein
MITRPFLFLARNIFLRQRIRFNYRLEIQLELIVARIWYMSIRSDVEITEI